MQRKIKNMMLPIAMILGAIFYRQAHALGSLTAYLLFTMLLITYCKVSLSELRLTRMHAILLLSQLLLCTLAYLALLPFGAELAQGIFITILAPTATAAAVITGMLGGSVASLASYSFMNNFVVALVTPIAFSIIAPHPGHTFLDSLWHICTSVGTLLVLPFFVAQLLRWMLPRVHHQLATRQGISFYLWAVALTIVMGKTTYFILHQSSGNYTTELLLALLSLLVSLLLFALGRAIGRRYGDTVSGGQSLGQKNTILAIWMAQTYLSPLSSLAPAAYVVWQNSINSWQLWRKSRRDAQR